MSVVKFIELSGRSSESFEDAVRQTVERAAQTIRNIQSVWVKEFEGVVENNRVAQFQVIVKVSFLVGEGASLVGEGGSAGGVAPHPGTRGIFRMPDILPPHWPGDCEPRRSQFHRAIFVEGSVQDK